MSEQTDLFESQYHRPITPSQIIDAQRRVTIEMEIATREVLRLAADRLSQCIAYGGTKQSHEVYEHSYQRLADETAIVRDWLRTWPMRLSVN